VRVCIAAAAKFGPDVLKRSRTADSIFDLARCPSRSGPGWLAVPDLALCAYTWDLIMRGSS
jgi:hypothetical protein